MVYFSRHSILRPHLIVPFWNGIKNSLIKGFYSVFLIIKIIFRAIPFHFISQPCAFISLKRNSARVVQSVGAADGR